MDSDTPRAISGPLTPSATRALLDELGHRPRRQLGQNFLVDGNIVRKSLELARVAAGDTIVEIGPGLGTLTRALLEAGSTVHAVERDATMVDHLRRSLVPAYPDRFYLIEGDAVELPLGGLPAATEAFKIVANLPYAISSPWMEAVLGGRVLPLRMVLMLQVEAAQRYAAEPGSKSFGAISVFLQAAYRIAPGHRVSRTCFFPVPDIDSTLLNLERLERPYSFSPAGRSLVRSVFQQRRKQLAPLLRKTSPDAAARWLPALGKHGLRDDVRAESVPVEAWIELDRVVRARPPTG